LILLVQQAATDLFRHAPRWRYALFGTIGLTTLAFLFPPTHSSPPPPPPPPPPQVQPGPVAPVPPALYDPASDTRLQAFTVKVTGLATEPRDGYRCEQLVDALKSLDATDRKRTALRSSAEAKAALGPLASADLCQPRIDASDARFIAVSRAVAKADLAGSATTAEDAATAFKALDGFDRSRERYTTEAPLVAKGRGYAEMLDASTARIEALSHGSVSYANDKSPQACLTLADAVSRITAFDKARLTPAQKEMLAAGDAATVKIREGRTRLAHLAQVIATRERDASAIPGEQFLEASSAITPFDEAIATPEQRQTLDAARKLVTPIAWSLLEDKLAILAREATPERYAEVAHIYDVLKDQPGEALTLQQRALLEQGKTASATLAASDDRIAALNAAAAAWRQRNGTVDPAVLTALHALTPFDQSRFQAPDTAAFETLASAEAIIRGSALGLTSQTKSHVPIAVDASIDAKPSEAMAKVLRDALRSDGFATVPTRADAAVIVTVAVDRLEGPTRGAKGVYVAWTTTAHAQVNAFWVSDNSYLFTTPITASRQVSVNEVERPDDAKGGSQAAALHGVIDKIIAQFETVTTKQ
jgi:hypothetical protein